MIENKLDHLSISNEEEDIERKKLRLLSLFDQKIWTGCSEIDRLPFQIVRQEDMTEMGIDVGNLLRQCIEENDFYSPKIPTSRTRTLSAHQFLFDVLPYHTKNFQGKYPQSAESIVEALKLIEELSPPTTSYVLFENGNIVTETPLETFRLVDSEKISMSIRLWRPDKDSVWLEGRYWAGHPKAHNIKDIYHMELLLTDQKGDIIYNLNQNLPPNGATVLGNEWAADPYNNVAVFSDKLSENDINLTTVYDLAHEVGHVQQFNDRGFRDNFQKQTGQQIEDFPSSHHILEQDAWNRATRDLHKVEQTTDYTILPENWELFINERLKNY